MSKAHYIVIALSAILAVAPMINDAVPAKYSAIAAAILAILAALKVEAMKADQPKDLQ